jgi:hypothetical protein
MKKEVLETLTEGNLLSELVLEKADNVFANSRRSMESRYQFRNGIFKRA